MPTCTVCGCTEFDLHDGKYYCQECDTQTEESLQIVQDTDVGFSVGREVGSVRHQSFNVENFDSWLTVEGFNIILKKQVEALIALGASGNLMHTVLQIWTKYLQNCQVAFVNDDDNWKPKLSTIPRYRDYEVSRGNEYARQNLGSREVRKPWESRCQNGRRKFYASSRKPVPPKKIQPFSKPDVEEPEDIDSQRILESATGDNNADEESSSEDIKFNSESSDDSDMFAEQNFSQFANEKLTRLNEEGRLRLWSRRNCQILVDSLRLLHTVSICYAGLLLNDDHIALWDILRWIHDGQIPYTNAWTVLPQNMMPQGNDFLIFRTTTVPSRTQIVKMTKSILNFVGFKSIPHKSFEPVALRIVAELNLPLSLVRYINQLVQRGPQSLRKQFVGDWFIAKNSKPKTLSQEHAVAALCIVILKILFGLDGAREKEASEAARKANDGLKLYFVFDEWIEFSRLRLNLYKEVFTAEIKADNPKPNVAIDVDLFHDEYWSHTSSIKELEPKRIYFQKTQRVKTSKKIHTALSVAKNRRKGKSAATSAPDDSSTTLKKKSKTASIVEINMNLRKIVSVLIAEEANRLRPKAKSFPMSSTSCHSYLDRHPNSLLKANFTRRDILVKDETIGNIGFWKQSHHNAKFNFREYYEQLSLSFRVVLEMFSTTFNFRPHELSNQISKVENMLFCSVN